MDLMTITIIRTMGPCCFPHRAALGLVLHSHCPLCLSPYLSMFLPLLQGCCHVYPRLVTEGNRRGDNPTHEILQSDSRFAGISRVQLFGYSTTEISACVDGSFSGKVRIRTCVSQEVKRDDHKCLLERAFHPHNFEGKEENGGGNGIDAGDPVSRAQVAQEVIG